MSLATLDRLELCQETLISALDANDVEAVESAVANLHDAVNEVKAAGGWRDIDTVRTRARRVLALIEAARIRVNFLTDQNRQRIEGLTALRGHVGGGAYRRDGAIAR